MNRRSFLSIPLVGLIPEKALSIAPAVTAVDAAKVTEWVGLDLASKWDWDTGLVHRGEAIIPADKTSTCVLSDPRCIVPKFHIPSEVDERTMRQIKEVNKWPV